MKVKNLKGKIVTYPGSTAAHRKIIDINAGVVLVDRENSVITNVIFGSIENVSKRHIIGVYDISQKEEVMAMCQACKELRVDFFAEMKRIQDIIQTKIEKRAKDHAIEHGKKQ